VGAAVLTADGLVTGGCNIENASYGLTVCAERVAIFSAVATGHSRILKLAVSTGDTSGAPSRNMPCGACLQVMSEFMDPSAEVLIDQVGRFKLEDLLSRPFHL
jgi:cytidine deaminase